MTKNQKVCAFLPFSDGCGVDIRRDVVASELIIMINRNYICFAETITSVNILKKGKRK